MSESEINNINIRQMISLMKIFSKFILWTNFNLSYLILFTAILPHMKNFEVYEEVEEVLLLRIWLSEKLLTIFWNSFFPTKMH